MVLVRNRGVLMNIEDLYKKMCVIRHTERKLEKLFHEGKLSGTLHMSIGQEAIAVAVANNLNCDDAVFASHRCHGHYLAYGGSVVSLVAEMMGKEDGVCAGRGGSQHLNYKKFFSNGIQGGIVGNAVGMALAEKMKQSNNVVVVFLGDGTLGQGLVYESLNFASLHKLPVLFVLENNKYAQSTPIALTVAGSILKRAEAFDIKSNNIQSNDVIELCETFNDAFHYVREEKAPFFQVVETYRLCPHSKGDDFRDKEEIERWKKLDPLLLAEKYLSKGKAKEIRDEAENFVEESIKEADNSPFSENLEEFCESLDEYPFPKISKDITFVESLNKSLEKILEDKSSFVIGEDILDPYGGAFKVTRGLSTKYPDQVIPAPISEQGITSWCTGAAMGGMRPIMEIMFGDFLTLSTDQLVNHAVKYQWMYNNQVKVPMVIRTPMGGGRGYGPTHSQSIEKIFFGIPGLTIIAPSHLLDAGELLIRSVESDMPVLFVENKLLYKEKLIKTDNRIDEFYVRYSTSKYPTIHLSLDSFNPSDAVIVCYGYNCLIAMESAIKLLIEHEILCDIIVPSLVSPLPSKEICEFMNTKRVFVIEEGYGHFGWGAEVIASISEESSNVQSCRISSKYCPIPASRKLEEKALISTNKITQAVVKGVSDECL